MTSAPRRVLLVDANAESLARTAARLRERGIKVSLANGAAMACERARGAAFDMVIASREVTEASGEEMGLLDALALELGRTPPYVVLVEDTDDGSLKESVRHDDVDGIVSRVLAVAPRSSIEPSVDSVPPSLSGTIATAKLGETLRALSLEKRTGALAVNTVQGAGEVRLVDGEVVDAVYRSLEGVKALSRMMSESEGTFAFTPGSAPVMRRVNVPIVELLGTCDAERVECERLRNQLGDVQQKALIAVDGQQGGPVSDVASAVLARLRSPASLDQLLDDVPALDSETLAAIAALDSAGRIKRLSQSIDRVPIAAADQLHLVRALVAKGRAPGFAGPARLVFAGTPAKIAVLSHTVLGLADSVPPADAPPNLPIPHSMSVAKLGDGVDLELVALPLVPVYAPLWPISLAGAAVVVRIDEAASTALDDACGAVDVQVAEAQALLGTFDESNVGQVASLIRAALDARQA